MRELVFPASCDNACWMGIEPNVSTVDEALKILEKNYGPENVIYNENAVVATLESHKANWYDRVTVFYSNNVVDTVFVWLSEDNLEVKNLVSEIGDPEAVVLMSVHSDIKCITASLAYPQKGLNASLSSLGNPVGVGEDRIIGLLTISSPRTPDDSTGIKIVPWEGYRKYCPEKWLEKE